MAVKNWNLCFISGCHVYWSIKQTASLAIGTCQIRAADVPDAVVPLAGAAQVLVLC